MWKKVMTMKIMKIKYWALPLVCLVMLQSCFKEDEEYWDESATIRLENAIQDYRGALVNSEYGWVMDFYPDQTFTEGGYAYTMKFENDGNVTVSYELDDPTESRTSMYSIEGGEGPVLTFDTYNEFMHHFANPSDVYYEGRGGDYEFVLQRKSDAGDYIRTLGRKSKNHMPMYKLTMPASEYLQKVSESAAFLTNTSFVLSDGTNSLALTRSSDAKVFLTEDEVAYPYVYTDTGIRLLTALPLGEDSVGTLNYAEDMNSMVSAGASVQATLDGSSIVDGMFENMEQRFTHYEFVEMSSDIQACYDRFVAALSAASSSLNELSLAYDRQSKSYVLYVGVRRSGTNRQIYYRFNAVLDGSNVQWVYAGTDDNGTIYLGYDGMQDLINVLSGKTYAVSSLEGPLNTTVMHWESGSTWMNVSME